MRWRCITSGEGAAVAAALMENVGEIIEEPTIEQVDLIAARLPR
jgi:hypothetical protein